jgi:hypothetical protein
MHVKFQPFILFYPIDFLIEKKSLKILSKVKILERFNIAIKLTQKSLKTNQF